MKMNLLILTILQLGMLVVGNHTPALRRLKTCSWKLLQTCLYKSSPDAGEALLETMMGIVVSGRARRGMSVTTNEP